MRALAVLLLLPLGVACGGGPEDAREVRVSMNLRRAVCAKEGVTCTGDQLIGEGVVVTSEEGSTVFAELETKHGPLAMLEIIYNGSSAEIRYREIENGKLVFKGSIIDGRVDAPSADSYWTRAGLFEFHAAEGEEVRIVERGVIEPAQRDVVPGGGGSSGGGSSSGGSSSGGGVIVVIHDDPDPVYVDDDSDGCEGDTSDPAPDPDPDPDYDGSGGCEGDTTTGDPDYDGSGGCEGDTSTGTDTSGGCDGDSADSSSGGCEGDGATMSFAAYRSLFRLTWPIGLVGFINRRLKARAERKRQQQSSP